MTRATHDPSRWLEHFEPMLGNPTYHLATYLSSAHSLLHSLMRIGTGAILEVGAGSGRGSVLIKRLQPTRAVVAVDLRPHFIGRFCHACGTRLEAIVQADTLRLPFRAKAFDVAFSEGLLEHYDNEWITRAVREQLRVAAAVVVVVPTHLHVDCTCYGDERRLNKLEWLRLLGHLGVVVDLQLLGAPGSETNVQITLVEARA